MTVVSFAVNGRSRCGRRHVNDGDDGDFAPFAVDVHHDCLRVLQLSVDAPSWRADCSFLDKLRAAQAQHDLIPDAHARHRKCLRALFGEAVSDLTILAP